MLCNIIETDKIIDEKLEAFYNLHLSSQINLTAIKDKEEFYIKHYLDSIYYFYNNGKPVSSLVDIGSGGGFPGIVLGIFYQDVEIVLVESIRKKCDFLNNAIERLELKNIKVINNRAENIKGKIFKTITARGVAKVKDMLKYTYHLSDKNTTGVLYKGEQVYQELEESKVFINKELLDVETVRIEKPFTRTYCIISR